MSLLTNIVFAFALAPFLVMSVPIIFDILAFFSEPLPGWRKDTKKEKQRKLRERVIVLVLFIILVMLYTFSYEIAILTGEIQQADIYELPSAANECGQ